MLDWTIPSLRRARLLSLLAVLLTAIMFTLKLIGTIAVSWLFVFAPLLLVAVGWFVFFVVISWAIAVNGDL